MYTVYYKLWSNILIFLGKYSWYIFGICCGFVGHIYHELLSLNYVFYFLTKVMPDAYETKEEFWYEGRGIQIGIWNRQSIVKHGDDMVSGCIAVSGVVKPLFIDESMEKPLYSYSETKSKKKVLKNWACHKISTSSLTSITNAAKKVPMWTVYKAPIN